MLEKIFEDIFLKIGVHSKNTVYASITPGVGLEMIVIDPQTKTVSNYGCKPLNYIDTRREIEDYDAFKEALRELFTELGISPKCNLVLNVPNVHIGKIELPLMIDDESVYGGIYSDLEQVYLFKNEEPMISWIELPAGQNTDTKIIFYSALKKRVVDKFKEVCAEIGTTLMDVNISAMSILNALSYSGATQTQMAENTLWNLMIVNSNGYFVFVMNGKYIIDVYDEPMPLKTYELSEIYNVISDSAMISLMNFPANYLYIVSETDMVSAELLASKMQYEGTVNFLENNSYKKGELLPTSLEVLPDQAKMVSIEAIGICASRLESYPISFNFFGNQGMENASGENVDDSPFTFDMNGREVILTRDAVRKSLIVVAILLFIPVAAAFAVVPVLNKNSQKQLDDINAQVQNIQSQIDALTVDVSGNNNSFDVKNEIKTVLANNKVKLMSYIALGESVPRGLWITYFVAKDDGKIDIKGVSGSVEDVYLFYKNIKSSLFNMQLRLKKLEIQSAPLEDVVNANKASNYDFEISNMTMEAEPSADAIQNGDGAPNNNDSANVNPSDSGAKSAPNAKPAGKTGAKSIKNIVNDKVNQNIKPDQLPPVNMD